VSYAGVATIWFGWLYLAARRARRQNYPVLPHLIAAACLGPVGVLSTWWLTRQPMRKPEEWEALNLAAHLGRDESPLAETAQRQHKEAVYYPELRRWIALERALELDRALTAGGVQLGVPALMLVLGILFSLVDLLRQWSQWNAPNNVFVPLGLIMIGIGCGLVWASRLPRPCSSRLPEMNLLALRLAAGESLPAALTKVLQGGNLGFTRSRESLPEPLALPGLLKSASHQLSERRYYHARFARFSAGALVGVTGLVLMWFWVYCVISCYGGGCSGNLG
jgi:hypothetical protein